MRTPNICYLSTLWFSFMMLTASVAQINSSIVYENEEGCLESITDIKVKLSSQSS